MGFEDFRVRVLVLGLGFEGKVQNRTLHSERKVSNMKFGFGFGFESRGSGVSGFGSGFSGQSFSGSCFGRSEGFF